MKDIDGFMVMNPGVETAKLEVRCVDHPLWEAMKYHVLTDHFACTAGRADGSVIPPCEWTISANYIWERLQ